jgi:hypothetical protein
VIAQPIRSGEGVVIADLDAINMSKATSMVKTSVHTVEADGVRVFYRAAGNSEAPVILLLHGSGW